MKGIAASHLVPLFSANSAAAATLKGILETCRLTLDTTAAADDVHLTVTTLLFRVALCPVYDTMLLLLLNTDFAFSIFLFIVLLICNVCVCVCALLFSSTELIAQKRATSDAHTLPLLTANLFAMVRRACRDDVVDHHDHYDHYSFTSLSHSIPVCVF